MNGLAVSVGFALVVLVQVGMGWVLVVRSRRAEENAERQRGASEALAARATQAESIARDAAAELAIVRGQLSLGRLAQGEDRERLARVEVATSLSGEALHRLGDAVEAERTSSSRLAIRLAGVSARLALGLEDAEANLAEGRAAQAGWVALRRDVEAAFVAQGLTEDRLAEAERRLGEQADWLTRSHEPWLQSHDLRIAALELRTQAIEAVNVAHERWLRDSHELWLLRHDKILAELQEGLEAARAGVQAAGQALESHGAWRDETYLPAQAAHAALLASHQDRLAGLEDRIDAADRAHGAVLDLHTDALAAQHRWLEQSHEPWLQRHDLDVAQTRSTLDALLERMQRGEIVIGACQRWLAESHEPWLAEHEARFQTLVASIDSRPTYDQLHELRDEATREREARRIRDGQDAAEAAAALDLKQGDLRARLDALTEALAGAQVTLNGTVTWLGTSHEPWLKRHESEIKRLLIELPTFTGALEKEVATLGQVQRDSLDLVEPLLARSALPRLQQVQRELSEAKTRRRDARRRGLLPKGVPGPCEGIRLGHGRRPILVVAYSGMQDVFGWLPRLESLDVQVVHLVDTTETWYVDGCDGAGSIAAMMEMTREAIVEFDYERLIVIGQSMGGYAAMRFGPELGADLIGVFGPQTHHLTQSGLERGELLRTPERVIDVRPDLIESRTPVHIMVSRSEDDNAYVWDDHAHLVGLHEQPAIRIHVCASDDHGVSGYLSRTGKLSGVLTAFFDMAEGRAASLDLDDL